MFHRSSWDGFQRSTASPPLASSVTYLEPATASFLGVPASSHSAPLTEAEPLAASAVSSTNTVGVESSTSVTEARPVASGGLRVKLWVSCPAITTDALDEFGT